MATKRAIYICIILIIATWLLGSITEVGAQSYTLKCRETGHMPKVHVIEVGDVPGHIVLVGENAGVLSCDDGSIATTSTKWMTDMTKGSGKSLAYELISYEDGSTTWVKSKTTVTAEPERKTGRWEGTFEYVKGTGRFEGIRGSASYTGKRLVSTPSAGAQYYVDLTITYTLPSK